MKIMASGPITSWQIDGETVETMTDFIFLGSRDGLHHHCRWWLHEIKTIAAWTKSYDKPRQHPKKQRHYFANKVFANKSQSYDFSTSHEWMWELDHKESWTLKNWCFWTVVLEKTLENPLDCMKIKPVNPKGNQSWIFIGRTDGEGHLMQRTDSFEKTLMLGKIEGRRRRGRQGMRWLDGITYSVDMSLSKLRSWWWTRKPGMLQSMGSERVRHDYWTELNMT